MGGRLNVYDVMSRYCQRRKGVVVERLDKTICHHDEWQDILVEDRHSTPAEIAATRLDFRSWLRTLSKRERSIAMTLAIGETTQRVAHIFQMSAGRVSQLRREFCQKWRQFIGETDPHTAAALGGVAMFPMS